MSLRATGPIASDAGFLAEMNQEVRDVEDDLPKILKYYPVFSLGITFKLGP